MMNGARNNPLNFDQAMGILRRKRKNKQHEKRWKNTHLVKKTWRDSAFSSFDNCDNNGDVHQQILDFQRKGKEFFLS